VHGFGTEPEGKRPRRRHRHRWDFNIKLSSYKQDGERRIGARIGLNWLMRGTSGAVL